MPESCGTDDLSYLFVDPRPDLADTRLWDKLLKAIPTLDDRSVAYHLQTNLWSMRSAGVIMRRQIKTGRLMFEPIIGKGGDFDSVEFFDEMKREHLLQYSPEIQQLFRKVDGYDWRL